MDDSVSLPNLDDSSVEEREKYELQFRRLADYCQLKNEAEESRRVGATNHARDLEARADRIYDSLPEGWRW